jgi:hypothetical protein
MTPEEKFTLELLAETKTKYEASDLFLNPKDGKRLYYSVCATPIQQGEGILLGINWGADRNSQHRPQDRMPDNEDIKEVLTYRFIQRSKPYLERYLNVNFTNINLNYSNLCFFRTSKEIDLIPEDYKSSLELFKKYVDFIKPKWIFSLGINNYKILTQFGYLTNPNEYFDIEQKYRGITAKLWDYNFYAVPHPNAHLHEKSREEIWEKIGEQFSNKN